MTARGTKPPAGGGAGRTGGPDKGHEPANRKLIRPRLEQHEHWPGTKPSRRRRTSPPTDETGTEAAHFHKQANLRSTLVVTLEDGTVLRGVIEWYDRDAIKLRPDDGPGLVILKQAILHTARDGNAATQSRRGRRA